MYSLGSFFVFNGHAKLLCVVRCALISLYRFENFPSHQQHVRAPSVVWFELENRTGSKYPSVPGRVPARVAQKPTRASTFDTRVVTFAREKQNSLHNSPPPNKTNNKQQ